MSNDSLDHQIGRISGRMEAIETNQRDLEHRIDKRLEENARIQKEMVGKVDKIHDAVTAHLSAWKTVATIGACLSGIVVALAAVVGAAVAVWRWVTGR